MSYPILMAMGLLFAVFFAVGLVAVLVERMSAKRADAPQVERT